jgi:uncharacterized membrane protein
MNLRPFVLAAALAVLVMVGLSAWAWGQVPADGQIPIHWNLAGEVDGYAPKAFGLLFMPGLSIGLAALLAILPRFEPRAANLARSGRAYVWVGTGIVWVLVLVHLAVVLAAVGRPLEIGLVVALGIGVLFVVLGNVLGKVRSNFIFGVRTPWTLASDRSWNRTHRLVGRLFVVLGLAVLATGLLGGAVPEFGVLMGGLVAVLVVAVVYSYRVWRDDPDKQPIGRQPAA